MPASEAPRAARLARSSVLRWRFCGTLLFALLAHAGAVYAQESDAPAPAAAPAASGEQPSDLPSPAFDPSTVLPSPSTFASGSQTASGFLNSPGAGVFSRRGFHFTIDEAVRYTDNARNLASGVATPAGRSRGDLYAVTTLGASYRKVIGLQEVFFSGTFGDTRYNRNASLDRQLFNVSGGMDWRLGSVCAGTFTAALSQSEQPYESATLGQINSLTRSRSVDYAGRCHVYGRFFATYGVNYRTTSYSTTPLSDQRQLTYSGGIEYALPRLHTIGLRVASTRVDFEDSTGRALAGLADSIDQVQVGGYYQWRISPKTQISLGYGWNEFSSNSPFFGSRKTSSPYYNASLTWLPTAKLSFRFSYESRPSPASGVNANIQENRALSLSVNYRYSPKLSFLGAIARSETKSSTFNPLTGLGANSTIVVDTLSLDANYKVSPFLTASLGYRYLTRTDKVVNTKIVSNLYTFRLSYQR